MHTPGTLVATNITRSHGSTHVLVGVSLVERALATFEGTLLVVSHDRRFLEAVVPTRVLEVPGTRKSL